MQITMSTKRKHGMLDLWSRAPIISKKKKKMRTTGHKVSSPLARDRGLKKDKSRNPLDGRSSDGSLRFETSNDTKKEMEDDDDMTNKSDSERSHPSPPPPYLPPQHKSTPEDVATIDQLESVQNDSELSIHMVVYGRCGGCIYRRGKIDGIDKKHQPTVYEIKFSDYRMFLRIESLYKLKAVNESNVKESKEMKEMTKMKELKSTKLRKMKEKRDLLVKINDQLKEDINQDPSTQQRFRVGNLGQEPKKLKKKRSDINRTEEGTVNPPNESTSISGSEIKIQPKNSKNVTIDTQRNRVKIIPHKKFSNHSVVHDESEENTEGQPPGGPIPPGVLAVDNKDTKISTTPVVVTSASVAGPLGDQRVKVKPPAVQAKPPVIQEKRYMVFRCDTRIPIDNQKEPDVPTSTYHLVQPEILDYNSAQIIVRLEQFRTINRIVGQTPIRFLRHIEFGNKHKIFEEISGSMGLRSKLTDDGKGLASEEIDMILDKLQSKPFVLGIQSKWLIKFFPFEAMFNAK